MYLQPADKKSCIFFEGAAQALPEGAPLAPPGVSGPASSSYTLREPTIELAYSLAEVDVGASLHYVQRPGYGVTPAPGG